MRERVWGNIRQRVAVAFGVLMFAVIVLMTPWTEEIQGQSVVLLGAWAPLWDPPSPTAEIDALRLAIEASLVVGVTGLCVWMMRD